MSDPVIIVGGGLSGLTTAKHLQAQGIPYVVIEKSDTVGGRLKTDLIEGYTCDHGFQTVCDAYPAFQQELTVSSLSLQPFEPGAWVFDGEFTHLISQSRPLASALSPLMPLSDKLNILKLNKVAESSHKGQWSPKTSSTQELIRSMGFTQDFLAGFLQPFFGSIFLDRELNIDASQFLFVWHMLATGQTTLPARGIQAIPQQLASTIPTNCLMLGQPVTSLLKSKGIVCGVRLGKVEMPASRVVLATNPTVSLALLECPPQPSLAKPSSCVYFKLPHQPYPEKLIHLSKEPSRTADHFVPLTNVAPSFAPKGKHLASMTVVGTATTPAPQLIESCLSSAKRWFGDIRNWEPLAVYRLEEAQMAQLPGFRTHRTLPAMPNLFVSGELMTDSSINGAIQSGFQTATKLVQELA